jgi:hypothetical protein
MLVCADDVRIHLPGDNTDTIKHTGNLTDVNKEVDVKVNSEKTKYMLMSHHQNAGKKS